MKFFIQNAGWSILHPRQAAKIYKAMRLYRKKHPACEITGSTKGVQIHHIVPVWADPSLAADPNNFIALSSRSHIHLLFGHDGSFGKKYVPNIKKIAKKMRDIKKESVIIKRKEDNVNIENLTFFKRLRKKLVDFAR